MPDKNFNPDYDYSFWFWKTKFNWILEMLALLIDYEFVDGEIKGMLQDLANTNDEDASRWCGGLHYGEKGTMYINMALDNENRDMVHICISTNKKMESQIQFVDLLQCKYEGFTKYKIY